MGFACDLGTSDKHLAAGQSVSFPHTCSENSYHVRPTGTATGEGKKSENKIHRDDWFLVGLEGADSDVSTTRLAS